MADQKISQLTDGGNAQAADEFVVARSGSNFRIDGASVAAAATSVGTLTSLTVSGATTLASTSGNVGIGCTPLVKAQIRTQTNGNLGIQASTVITGGNKINNFNDAGSASSPLELDASAIGFLIAGAEKMRLDASGNLGLGVTPNANAATNRRYLSIGGLAVSALQYSATIAETFFNSYFNSSSQYVYQNTGPAGRFDFNAQVSGGFSWSTAASGTAGNAISFTQAMTLDASGNLGVGVTPSYKLHVATPSSGAGAAFRYTGGTNNPGVFITTTESTSVVDFNASGSVGNSILTFSTNGPERARITSGGYFKASDAGTYAGSTGSYHEFRTSASTRSPTIQNTHATQPFGILIEYTAAAPNGAGNDFVYCSDNAAARAVIRSNGGLANYQANNVDLSDARTKTDITPAASMWDKVAALEIVTYKYVDQTHDDVNLGVIAQQVETVEPVWVDADGFGETPEGEEPFKTVYTKDITFAAIKALQEAMARIEALEARLEALEA